MVNLAYLKQGNSYPSSFQMLAMYLGATVIVTCLNILYIFILLAQFGKSIWSACFSFRHAGTLCAVTLVFCFM